ncbi:MAG: hypothetical protein KAJ12_01565 [Bacteroidetes bacterium]|nr:hypothetical protein [Bacteroidota bacterium]
MSILYRAVGHVSNIDDLLAYADNLFFGKELSAEYGSASLVTIRVLDKGILLWQISTVTVL